jgi:class 3 adenylate cyclase
LTASAKPREERRIVSVIFVDLVGFTERSEQLDPEDVRAILAPYHDCVRNEIESFGGSVEKFVGDAVVGSSAPRRLSGTMPSAPFGRRSR